MAERRQRAGRFRHFLSAGGRRPEGSRRSFANAWGYMPTKGLAGRKASRRGRPPGSTSDETRRRILASACECFGKRGYDITTNRDIGERAGVTAAALYQYFDSKLSLYVAAVK